MRIWRIVVYLLLPYALGNLIWRALRYPAYWNRWPERFGFVTPLRAPRVLWVHAVSVGEVRSAAPLVNALVERYPERRVVVTTMTPTGSEQVKELFGDRANLALRIVDPFDTMGFCVEAGDENLLQITERKFDARSVHLTLQYNFGQAPRVRQPRADDGQQQPQTGFPQ